MGRKRQERQGTEKLKFHLAKDFIMPTVQSPRSKELAVRIARRPGLVSQTKNQRRSRRPRHSEQPGPRRSETRAASPAPWLIQPPRPASATPAARPRSRLAPPAPTLERPSGRPDSARPIRGLQAP